MGTYLKADSLNYWGTYVYNPNYCRPVVVQSPHSKKDANTGHQGIYVFKEIEALFYMVNGTHRCNSLAHSTCSGTTTSCSSTSQPFRISDLAHTITSIFHKTTEVLLNNFSNTHFIQLHGFSKRSTDPYVIISNGTQIAPSPDYISTFIAALYNEDTSLTFKVAHLDLSWTRLRGFSNTQGRTINASANPCNNNATNTNGRFIHLEQEKTKLRDNVAAWNKVANALSNTFTCSPLSIQQTVINHPLKVYPNPTDHSITVDSDNVDSKLFKIYNLLGQDLTLSVNFFWEAHNRIRIDLTALPSGYYILKTESTTNKIYKQ